MLSFNKLRLSGFKSFVEPTELLIEPGMTGVVGPNGCGKSNLVEAVRWVMGETSAKQMRGKGMEDMIFGGTANRPSRNIAEVVLELGNEDRTAPAQFNDYDQIEVCRRIERDKGSAYSVNSREVRARDVQLLFADSATGARSTALVSQGRIGAIIAAKPTDRRHLLEEAAGITGLHSRRHEAELRLRGAETNLIRLDDILATLDTQLLGLKKQARQATRYRNLSDHIRRAEANLYLLRWIAATADMESGLEKLDDATALVIKITAIAAAATTCQADAAAGLPDLRKAEAEAAAHLHRLVIAREGLDEEERRVGEAIRGCTVRLEQTAADMEREKTLASDADSAIRNVETERNDIETSRADEENAGEEAARKLAEITAEVGDFDSRLTELTDNISDVEARRASLTRSAGQANERVVRLTARADETRARQTELENDDRERQELDQSETRMTQANNAREAAQVAVEDAERLRGEKSEAQQRTQSELHGAQAALARLEAEEQALTKILEPQNDQSWPPVIDKLTVEPGAEGALGAALGEDLLAPADEPAPVHWRTLAPYSDERPLPSGVEPLSRLVNAPPALARRLAQIGVVENTEQANRLAAELTQGQRLVSRDGGLWRWDGFTALPGAATAAAARLEQRNRLRDVRNRLSEVNADCTKTRNAADQARQIATDAAVAEKSARDALRDCDALLTTVRDEVAELKQQAAARSSRLAAIHDQAAAIEQDIAETRAQADDARTTLDNLPDIEAARTEQANVRTRLSERRTIHVERQAAYENLVRLAEERRRRLGELDRELVSWRQRGEGAAQRLHHLDERRQTIRQELDTLNARPAEIEAQRVALLSSIDEAEQNRNGAADLLAQAETVLKEADSALKSAESDLAQSREERVRAEGMVEQSRQTVDGLAERIAESLDCTPDGLRDAAGLKDDQELPELDAIEKRVARLQRERDTMGPVNLRAEQEAKELSEQAESLRSERADLIEAIGKLRQGISELNREARERLLASFHEVDKHFQRLFVRLFGGGRAHLALTESDDPLEAGLDVMASPPGKRLQSLSLLSGGEQALTALALLFAVFMTNPAPICVLDEVDAPLDDANVDRFCSLLKEMVAPGLTRFLVITHHRMTMARMDRLYGVTMAERGVSQLVSVDLQEADILRESA